MLCPTRCGNALQFAPAGVTCRCGYSLTNTRGVLNFIGRDEGVADNEAGGGSVTDLRTFQQLTHVLNCIGKKNIPVAVEFGAGNGGWTIGMDRSQRFHEVYAIDASLQSQSMLRNNLSKPRMHLVCQSTEQLDFEAGSVDIVVARSFLRHVGNYEALLAKCARWLKPDGAAIFHEPCIQGKISIAFLTKLMLEFGTQPAGKGWDMMRRNLEVLYEKDVEQLHTGGQGWTFDVDALHETAQAAGFWALDVIDEDGRILTGFKRAILGAARDRSKVARYGAMVEAFGLVFSSSAPGMLVSPMVFFVFRKFGPDRKRHRKVPDGARHG